MELRFISLSETLFLSQNAFCDLISSFVTCYIFLDFYPSGIRVETNHLPYKRNYTVWGVTENSAEKMQFEIHDKDSGRKYKLTVAEYFKESYKMQLRCAFAVFVWFTS